MTHYKFFFFISYFTTLFLFLLFINLYYLEGIPHVPDSAAYLFMAKMFSLGHIVMPIPVSPEHFNFFPGILSIEKNTWLFQYPFGHPLLLTIGVIVGFPNLIPPLIGTASIFFLFLITKEIYNAKTAYFLLLLPFLSPFFLENAASFMSHTTAAFYLIVSLYFTIRYLKNSKPLYYLSLAGLFLGLLFNTRPLTCLPFIGIISVLIIFYRGHNSKIRSFWFLLVGILPLICLWFMYNYITTGNVLVSQYYFINKDLLPFGTNGLLGSFSTRLQNVKILFNNLGPMLFNWPILVTYGLLCIPFMLRKNSFWDIFFFLSLFSLPFIYFFYNGTFIMYGPRFWYEITPFFFLLTARSFSLLFEIRKKITLSLLIILICLSVGKLFSFIPTHDPDYFSPLSLKQLKGFNFTDARILKEIDNNNIHNAVVLIEDCNDNWWCYGSVFPQNSPDFNTDVVYAKDLGNNRNQQIFQYFNNKSFYRINYYNLKLIPIK